MKAKKYLASFLSFLLCFALIPPCVFAQDSITLTVIDGTVSNNKNENYPNLTDGNKKTSWGLDWQNGTTSAYAIIKASRQITAIGYSITTGEDSRGYKNRNPKDWKLYGCNDYDESSKSGGAWKLLHSVKNDSILTDSNSASFDYEFDNDTPCLYYKLEITANRGDTYLKIGEFELFDAAAKPISFQGIDGKPGNNAAKENYTNLFDGKKSSDNYTKYCVDKGDVYVVAEASDLVVITAYAFTTGNDNRSYPGRNPKSWVLYGGNDYSKTTKDGTWEEIDSVTNDTVMKDENYTSFRFALENQKSYKYYKFDFKEDQGAGLMQLCEIEFEYTTDIHKWEEVSRTEPTCTEAGYIKRVCTDCGMEQTVEIPVIDHAWQEKSKTEPTCFEPGHVIESCSACGTERETDLSPLGHKQGADGKCENCHEYIIKVGDKYYCDLQKAIGEALYNVPVTLLQNIAIDSTLTIANQRILDLNGYTIKQINDCRVIRVSGNFTLRDSSENRTGMLCGGTDADGGGICVDEYKTFNMEGGTIFGCTASTSGGGIYVSKNAKLNMSGGVIKNCTVLKLHGGGIMNYGTAEIRDSEIINCSSESGGGGIYADGSYGGGTLNLYNSVIENCSVNINGGGGISAKATAVNVNDNTVIRKNTATENAAYNYGAGILATDKAIVNVNNSKITENTANEGAGILANRNSSIVLNNSEVTGNNADSAGGGIMLSFASLKIENGDIINNISKGNGGGIYASNSSGIEFNGGNIDGNSAQWGGGVYLHYGSEMTVKGDSYIKNNVAENNGGGIIVNDSNSEKDSTLNMTGGNISFNEAGGSKGNGKGNGGGICGQKNAVINISGGTIDSNTSINGGGVYLLNNSTLNLSGGDISGNTAHSGSGGGVYIDGKSNMKLNGGRVSQNNAKDLGGGIYVGGTISVSQTPQVNWNYLISSEEDVQAVSSNIYLPDGKTIAVGEEGLKEYYNENTGYIEPVLYVTAQSGTASITDSCADFVKFFRSDNIDYAVVYDGGVIKLVKGYKVKFMYADGDERTETVVDGKTVSEPEAVPYKNGYTFIGWLQDGKDYDFSKPVTGDMTLTPKWAESSKTSINITYSNVYVTGLNQKAKVYLAAYKSGRLIDFCVDTIDDSYFISYSRLIADFGLETDGANTITAFLWGENMSPLCEKAEIKLQ